MTGREHGQEPERRTKQTVGVTFASEEHARIAADALHHYADDRMKIARRRDRKERHLTGVSVERALAGFFSIAREARSAIEKGLRDARA